MGWDWAAGDPCAPHEAEWCATCNPNRSPAPSQPVARIPRDRPPTSGDSTRRPWEPEEAAVLVALYFRLPFFAGDDSQAENHAIATTLGRSPAAVDRQWRNVQDVAKEQQVQHVGQVIIMAVQRYQSSPSNEHSRAVEICRRRRWHTLLLLLGSA